MLLTFPRSKEDFFQATDIHTCQSRQIPNWNELFLFSCLRVNFLREVVGHKASTENNLSEQVSNFSLGILTFSSPALDKPSGIRAGWDIEINGRLEAEIPPASASCNIDTFVPYE